MEQDRFVDWFGESDAQGLSLFWKVCEPHFVPMLGMLRSALHSAAAPAQLGAFDTEVARDQRLLVEVQRGIGGDFSAYEASLCEAGVRWSQANVDLKVWHAVSQAFRENMVRALLTTYGHDILCLEHSLRALQNFMDRSTRVLTQEYLRECWRAHNLQGERAEEAMLGLAHHSEADHKLLLASQHRSHDLEVQNASIGETSRLKSEFLANMSHELRTPLNAVIGFAELLYDRGADVDAAQHQEFLGYILKGGQHLLQLINEVLDLAKVESGTMDFNPEPLELTKLVAEVCSVLGPLSLSRQVKVDCSVEPAVNKLALDPARLRQVLYNYVSNAIKFSNPAGTVQIRASLEQAGRFRIEVRDHGIGISASDVQRIFVEFQQLDSGTGKRHAGTGLGLALTKRIVEAQGGRVGVESELGSGSVFFAVLPCRLPIAVRASQRPCIVMDSGRATVLVVDGDEAHQHIVQQVLEQAGYCVRTAGTDAEAIALSAHTHFDAITLTIVPPEVTGLAVLHELRLTGLNLQTPVIAVGAEDRGMVSAFSVHDHLRKPILGPELLASLSQAGVLPYLDGAILVVDDDLPSLKLVETTLQSLGYQVVCSEDGAAALVAAEELRPRAVILDLLLPKLDGFEFLARFRSTPHNRDVPVIVWTSKDLTVVDRRRLVALAQGVHKKGDGKLKGLLDELLVLLGSQPPRAARLGEQDAAQL